jgi:ubiquinone/menaquinone biosynthesis C-methylase UbiE
LTAAPPYVRSPAPLGEDRAYLDFVLGLRTFWARRLYPSLRRDYEARLLASGAAAPRTTDEAAAVVEALPGYSLFGWMERNVQKMMWRRLERVVDPHVDRLESGLTAPVRGALGKLELDPELRLPGYYTETEFHIQPGGVWSGVANAFVYEVGAKIVMFGQNDDYHFHRLFVETAIAPAEYRAILDMGCGFGKSTRPFVDAFPNAEVVGIDLSAPNLMLAHQQAERLQTRITFSQRNAEHTGYPDASFDLVTGSMLIHELPMPTLRGVLTEAYRLLTPGGTIAFLDFARTGEPFRDFIMEGHGARNNEPYMPHLFRTDLASLCQDIGYDRVDLLPFDERGAGLLTNGRWPRRDEWHFPWAVLRAEKASTCPT